jgi:hypothetical protein
MKTKNKIKKLALNLFPSNLVSESIYNKERAEHIANYEEYIKSTEEYHMGGLFSFGYYTGEDGHYKKNPLLGEVEWNKMYPNGYTDWAKNQRKLTAYGEQELIDKINELIDFANK